MVESSKKKKKNKFKSEFATTTTTTTTVGATQVKANQNKKKKQKQQEQNKKQEFESTLWDKEAVIISNQLLQEEEIVLKTSLFPHSSSIIDTRGKPIKERLKSLMTLSEAYSTPLKLSWDDLFQSHKERLKNLLSHDQQQLIDNYDTPSVFDTATNLAMPATVNEYKKPVQDLASQQVEQLKSKFRFDNNQSADDANAIEDGNNVSVIQQDDQNVLDQIMDSTVVDLVQNGLDYIGVDTVVDSIADFLDAGNPIPIPIGTIAIDTYKETVLLLKGRTHIGSSIGHIFAHTTTVGIGSFSGTVFGTLVFPGVGTVVGGFIGTMLANKAYNGLRKMKLKKLIEEYKTYQKETNIQLNELIDQVESQFEQQFVSNNNEFDKMGFYKSPQSLKEMILNDQELNNFVKVEEDVTQWIQSDAFKRRMKQNSNKSTRVLGRIQHLKNESQTNWNNHMSSVQNQLNKIRDFLREKTQEINNLIQIRKQGMSDREKQVQKRADKMGIKLKSEAKKKV